MAQLGLVAGRPVRALCAEHGRRANPLTPSSGFGQTVRGNDDAVAVGQADETALEPVVILGLLNSMAVVLAATETLLANWDTLSADGDTARHLLERVAAHARVVTDALELAALDVPPSTVHATERPD